MHLRLSNNLNDQQWGLQKKSLWLSLIDTLIIQHCVIKYLVAFNLAIPPRIPAVSRGGWFSKENVPQNQPPRARQSEKLYKIKPPRTQARDNSPADITKSTVPVSRYSHYKIICTLSTWLSAITKSTSLRSQTRYKISIIQPGLEKTNDFVMLRCNFITESGIPRYLNKT